MFDFESVFGVDMAIDTLNQLMTKMYALHDSP